MASSKLYDTWKLMSDYKLEADPNSIGAEMLCLICKGLMIDACHSICGCQYCYKCINEYIGNEEKYCPGDKSKCKEDFLSLKEDVIRDSRMNKRIYRSKVLCPNKYCDCKLELRQLHEHLRLCSKQSMECPYTIIGCDSGKEPKDAIISHLHNDALSHSLILMECITNMKNENHGQKPGAPSIESDIIGLKKEMVGMIERIRKEIIEENATQNKEMIKDMADQKIKFEIQTAQQTKEFSQLKAEITQQKDDNMKMNKELLEKMEKMALEKKNFIKLIEENEHQIREITEQCSLHKKEIGQQKQEISQLKVENTKQNKEVIAQMELQRKDLLQVNEDNAKQNREIREEMTLQRNITVDPVMINQIVMQIAEQIAKQTSEIYEKMAAQRRETVGGIEEQRNELVNLKEKMIKQNEYIAEIAKQISEEKNELLILVKEMVELKAAMKYEECERVNKKKYFEKQLKNVANEIEGKFLTITMETKKLKEKMDKVTEDTDIATEEEKQKIMRSIVNLKSLYSIIDEDIVWRIDEISKKRETMIGVRIFSPSFYSNNYRFCLYTYFCRDGDGIMLCCMIMKGDNDEKVEWPMRLPVTLGIVNQDTLKAHKTETYKYDTNLYKTRFNKPKNEANELGISTGGAFMKYSSMKNTPSIIVDDSIIISCVIGDK